MISTIASSIRLTQSHSRLPAGVRRSSARWPMPNAGEVPMPISSPSRRNVAMWDLRNCPSVVHCCPVGSTNCRSSSQIAHSVADRSAGAYCVPQVVQIQASFMAAPSSRTNGNTPSTDRRRDLIIHTVHFDVEWAHVAEIADIAIDFRVGGDLHEPRRIHLFPIVGNRF